MLHAHLRVYVLGFMQRGLHAGAFVCKYIPGSTPRGADRTLFYFFALQVIAHQGDTMDPEVAAIEKQLFDKDRTDVRNCCIMQCVSYFSYVWMGARFCM